MLNGKKEQSQILNEIAMEEQTINLNLSFSVNTRSFIAVTRDLSLGDHDHQTEECPSIQLSVIDRLDKKRFSKAK